MKLEVMPASTGWTGVDASAIKLVTTNAQTSIKTVYVKIFFLFLNSKLSGG